MQQLRMALARPEGWFGFLGLCAASGVAAVPEFVTFAGDAWAVRKGCYSVAAMLAALALLLLLVAYRRTGSP